MREDTKTKILNVAEKLFAENGLQATSLRQIINEAGVNVASVHYHFGSKEKVVHEILMRRLLPINDEKLERLDELEAEAGDKPVPLQSLIAAFIMPHIEMNSCDKGQAKLFLQLMGELENAAGKLKLPQNDFFSTVFNRFLSALKKTLPDLSDVELKWRFKFMLGSVHSVLIQQSMPKNFPLRDDESGTEQIIAYLTTFLDAGFKVSATDNS
jgi:AcrR family transcriptional regulator